MTVIIIIFSCLILTLGIGLLPAIGAKKVNEKLSVDEFFLGKRGLGVVLIFFTTMATWYSSSLFLGAVAEVYTKGLQWMFGFTSSAIAGLVFFFLGPKIKEISDRKQYITQADMFIDRFKSNTMGYLASLIGIIFMIPYIVVQMVGTGYILEVFTDGKIPYWLGVLIGLLICLTFIYFGGVRSVAWTDVFLGILFLISIWGVVALITIKGFGTVPNLFRQAELKVPELLTMPGPEGVTWTYFLSMTWVIGLGGYMWPHLFMRIYASDSVKSVRKVGSFIIFASLFAQLPIVFGALVAAVLLPNLDAPDTALLVLANQFAPPWVIGILGAGGIAASLSTVNSLIHAEGVLISKDLYSKIAKKDAQDDSVLKVSRLCIVLICILSYFLSLTKPAFLWTILAQAYGGVCQFFPLTIAALYWKKVTKEGAITGFIVGIATSLFFTFGPIPAPFGIVPQMWGMLANTVCLVAVSLLTQSAQNQKITNQFFLQQ
ncbi:sodium:solute symporter family protein [Metabacillus arenae]|uniref:Sodium:solute symporter family protein n=1 Tax=Metabacillus arenae TaxID=2771434 RepID=A0A926RXL9_9BACI|nr:sodium:solute symporter family protein [Metabacillus arenae]MBD1382023.1 sodium:solute symporter family protein [Metabacillus arenae]